MMKKLFALPFVMLCMLVFCTAAYAATQTEKLYYTDPKTKIKVTYTYTFEEWQNNQYKFQIVEDETYVTSRKGQCPSGKLTVNGRHAYTGAWGEDNSYAIEDYQDAAADSDCTQSYVQIYNYRTYQQRTVDYTLTRAAESSHNWGDWTYNADGTHYRACKHPVCTVTQTCSGTMNNWKSNGNDTHTAVCTADATHTHTVNCSGGKATCSAKAVCDSCNTAYGSIDEYGHSWGDWEYVMGSDPHQHVQTCLYSLSHTNTGYCSWLNYQQSHQAEQQRLSLSL